MRSGDRGAVTTAGVRSPDAMATSSGPGCGRLGAGALVAHGAAQSRDQAA